MHLPSRIQFTIACGITAFALCAPPGHSEIVLLQNGKSVAGQIISEDNSGLKIKSGSAQGPREVKLTREEIKQILRAADETNQIEKSTSPTELRRWAVSFFYAGTESTAAACISRVRKLDPSIEKKPLKEGAVAYRDFWNRRVLKELSAGAEHEKKRTLELARWAHDAELETETTALLRQAYSQDRSSTVVRKLISDWNVTLDSWIHLDLKPALSQSLLVQNVTDSGTSVAAEPDKLFAILPLRYDTSAGPQVFSQAFVQGRSRRGYYGIQLLPLAALTQNNLSNSGPVFERVELKRKESSQVLLQPKNTHGPRTKNGETVMQERLRARTETIPATGAAVLIVEVPKGSDQLSLDWGDGRTETIDLSFLKRMTTLPSDAGQLAPDSTNASDALRLLKNSSSAMIELAIARLGMIRDRTRPEDLENWSRTVDSQIIPLAALPEQQIRTAAWTYFSAQENAPAPALDALGQQPPNVLLGWIDTIRSATRDNATHTKIAQQLLGAILRSNDADVCEAAVALLMDFENEVDWRFLSTASDQAQLAALSRVKTLPREEAIRSLMSVARAVRPSSADMIVQQAKELKIQLSDPRDPIFDHWHTLKKKADRLAYLKVLQMMDLGDLLYCKAFSNILDDVLKPGVDVRVKEAALGIVVENVRRHFNPSQHKDASSMTGFPILLSISANDRVIQCLAEAVKSTSRPLRTQAARLLLLQGFAEEVEKGLVTSGTTPKERNEILKELLGDEMLRQCDGLPGLFGRMLKRSFTDNAEFVLSTLTNLAAQTPVDQRWRILAAVKSGVQFDELDRLAHTLPPPLSGSAARWLNELGHMTQQDRERLLFAQGDREREKKLESIDFRRAQLVDGRYNCLVVIEFISAEEPTAPKEGETVPAVQHRWQTPRRATIVLPPLELRSNEDDTYRVFIQDKQVGEGMARSAQRRIRAPDSLCPRLEVAPPEMTGLLGWGWLCREEHGQAEEMALGPAVLPRNRRVLEKPTADTLTMDIADYLKEGLRKSDIFPDKTIDEIVQAPYRITLRYASFGSFYGVGTAEPPKSSAKASSDFQLLNVMMVLERLD